ncbi:uncharacterized protein LOC113204631 [Frankliniella occidentalis]|uniref:Uncharacterized protein LOC113204631 n=1 Tax=Frankliniella occidentalis TaxID=133901 RepID=A0A6J1SAB9_FRAOC|nr:uncharacterized protein LOC113204631 [Frankliniella occidentalis]XP_026275651.1 uncharacterized protein LOC113204631 [Frankliniella occidentalis]XP_026275652.1 uncharacterized protein LOC113204631 [Frankliniella occidentalis]
MDADQHEQSLDRLPELALLEVLKLLPIKDLLTCRLVCKRLGELAMHPTVWQEKSWGWGENHQKLACPVLRLAPCLGRAEGLRSRDGCVHTLSTTRCAVEHLEIDANVKLSASALEAAPAVLEVALALQRQEVLGRLRSLWITLQPKDTTKGHDSQLYRTLALTSRLLETLVVEVMPEARATPGTECCFEGIQVPSSLKRVEFYSLRQETALVDFLLSTHAATLETVRFHGPASTSTLQLLAGLPRLRELTCRLQVGLEALSASESLQVLSIWVKGREEESASAEAVAGAESFLRQARQLRQVSLQCGYGAHSSQFPAALVKALAKGGARSHVEKLCVVCRCDGQQQLERALLDALPELPALRELDLDCCRRRQPQDESHRHEPLDESHESDEPYEQLLRGLTPATAPALRRLTVVACAHDWTHRPSVKALLAANPSLQVRVGWRDNISYDDDLKPLSTCRDCYACKLKCHPELREARYNSHVCFSLKQELSTCPTVHNHSNLSW